MDGHERWTSGLSEYLDGELPADEARAFDDHLAVCAPCRELAADLDAVRAAARELPDVPPGRDLWPGIRNELDGATVTPITRSGAGRRAPAGLFLTVPRAAAAAVALFLLGGAGAWLLGGPSATAPGADDSGGGVVAGTGVESGAEALPLAVRTAAVDRQLASSYAPEVERLEQALVDGRDRLDPATVRVLEKNLGIIDRAILESLDALESDPGNPWILDHLRRSWERKVTYLRHTADLLEPRGAD